MSIFPEPGRQAAHVLLDAVIAASDTSSDPEMRGPDLAFQRLAEIGAFSVEIEEGDSEQHVTVNLTNVLGGAMITIEHLARELAQSRGVSFEAAISDTRSYLDR